MPKEKKKREKLTPGEYFVLMQCIRIIGDIYSNFSIDYVYSFYANELRRLNQEPMPYGNFYKYFHKLIEKEYIEEKYSSTVYPGKHTFLLETLEYDY